jgi:CheY-like chemotaxis protein
MPGITGSDFLEQVGKLFRPRIPSIILSSVGSSVPSSLGFLTATKPIREADLGQLIARAMETASGESKSDAAATATPVNTAAQLYFTHFPATVLVVEDTDFNRRVVELMLAQLRITPTFCHDGEQAIDYVKEHQPDIIIMDVRMPVLDGYEATAAIRALGTSIKQPKILGLTANALSDERDRALAVGMDDYLTKPARRAMLYAALKKACPEAMGPVMGS